MVRRWMHSQAAARTTCLLLGAFCQHESSRSLNRHPMRKLCAWHNQQALPILNARPGIASYRQQTSSDFGLKRGERFLRNDQRRATGFLKRLCYQRLPPRFQNLASVRRQDFHVHRQRGYASRLRTISCFFRLSLQDEEPVKFFFARPSSAGLTP